MWDGCLAFVSGERCSLEMNHEGPCVPPTSVVCAWCRALIAGPPPGPGLPVSHGICAPCRTKVEGMRGMPGPISEEEPLVRGGQGRDAEEVEGNAVAALVCIIGLLALAAGFAIGWVCRG